MKRLIAFLALFVAAKAQVHSSVVFIGFPGGGGGGVLTGTTAPVNYFANEEQYVLELINRARANPAAESARLGLGLNDGLTSGTISETAKPPLAGIAPAERSAEQQAFWMAISGTAAAERPDYKTPKQRLTEAGYVFASPYGCAEIIGFQDNGGEDGLGDAALARRLYEQWFRNPESRIQLLEPACDEAGVGLVFKDKMTITEVRSGTRVVVQIQHDLSGSADFAFSAGSPSPAGPYILGVAYQDTNSNSFYDPGEGLPSIDVKMMPGGFEAKTNGSGAYAIPRGTTSGSLIATFSGTGVPMPTRIPFSATHGQNVKVDLVLPGVTSANATRIIGVSGDFDFGEVVIGSSRSRTLTITNSGNSPLTVTGISHSAPYFSGSFSGTIPVGASKEVSVSFQPAVTGSFSGTLTVNSDATSGPAALAEKGRSVIEKTVATPKINPGDSAFTKKLKVKISCDTPRAAIHYTLDGSEPTEQSLKYKGPFQLKEAATVKAKAYRGDYQSSAVATATYTKN